MISTFKSNFNLQMVSVIWNENKNLCLHHEINPFDYGVGVAQNQTTNVAYNTAEE